MTRNLPTPGNERRLVVVMGVSGSGKTLIGSALAEHLDVDYEDGDVFHPPANIAAMSSGRPLTDQDREPWLRAIRAWLDSHRDVGAVVSCSALRRVYRDILAGPARDVVFIHLQGDQDVIRARMQNREHFMPVSLLNSQLALLEPLEADETGLTVDLVRAPAEILDEASEFLSGRAAT